MSLTRTQFDALRAKGLTVEQIVRFENGETPKQSFLQETANDIKQTGTALKNTFTDTMNRVGQATAAENAGEQGMARTALQKTGAVARGLSSAVGDVVTGAVKTALPKSAEQGVKSALQSSIQAIAPIAKKIDEASGSPVGTWLEKYKTLDPKTKRDVDALFGIGQLALDVATAGVGKKGAEVAGKTILKGAEKTGQVLKSGTNLAGNVLESAGQQSVKMAIPLSKAEAGLVQTYRAKNPLLQRVFKPLAEQPRTNAVTAIEKGFAGTESMIGTQAKRESVRLWNETIAPALKIVKEKYDFKSAFSRVQNEINKVTEPSRRSALMEALDAMKSDYKNISKASYTKAQKIKSELDKFIPDKAFNGKPIAGSFKEVQKMLADDIRQSTYKVLKDDNIRADFLDYGNLKGLQEWGQKAMTGAKAKAGFGSFVSNMFDKATIPALTTTGKVLLKSGKLLKSISGR